MAKDSIRDFSATAGSNTDIQSVNIDENCPASGINNAIRELMVDLKNVSTGAVNLETPGADQLNVDNLRLDGNTISSTDTNGDISLSPNGSGVVDISGSSGATLKLTSTDTTGADTELLGQIDFVSSDSSTGSAGTQARIKGVYEDNGDSSGIAFITGASTGSGTPTITEKMRVDHNGNVGIGTANGDITSDGNANRTYVTIQGTANRGRLNLGCTASNGADTATIGFTNGANTVASISCDSDSGSQTAGNISLATAGSVRATINSSGELLVGASTFSNSSNVKRISGGTIDCMRNTTSAVNQLTFRNPNGTVGSISTSGSSTSFSTSSDYRLKEAVADMTGAIDRVKALAPKRFNFIEDADTTVDGFLAHEAQAVVPEAVTGTKDEVDDDGNAVMQGIDQSKLVPLLVGALKESIAKIETLETEMTALKSRLTALEA